MIRRAALTQTAVCRILKGVKEAGCEIAKVEIGVDGKLVVFTGSGLVDGDDMDQELAAFEARHGKG